MKALTFYTKKNITTEDKAFEYLLQTLRDSIFTWDYFVDFKKSIRNANLIKDELIILNQLLNKEIEEFNRLFLEIIKQYPRVRKALIILLAMRPDKLKNTQVIDDIKTMDSNIKSHLFNPKTKLTEEQKNELVRCMHSSGLYSLFNSGMCSLYDYCIGVEVGMDTNARKNRTGTSMENLVESIIDEFCSKNHYDYISQATSKRLLSKWNISIKLDKISRRFDFAIKANSELYLVEVNYYSGGGSKLKATAGEYKELENMLKNQGISFIWITDGLGWNTAKTALNETFIHNDYLFNLEMLKDGVLDEIVKN